MSSGDARNQLQQATALTIEITLMILVLLPGRLSALIPSSSQRMGEASFTRLTSLNDVLFTEDVLLDVSTRSRVECAKQCAQTEGCAMFTLYPGPQGPPVGHICRLFSRVIHLNDTCRWVSATGAKTFALPVGPLSCPSAYEARCGRCLMGLPDTLNYTDAQKLCRMIDNGQLVIPRNWEDLQCVGDFMDDRDLLDVWLGADDLGEPGQFRWVNGCPLPVTSTLWWLEDPDQLPGGRFSGQECTFLFTNDSGHRLLSSDECSVEWVFMCQRHYGV